MVTNEPEQTVAELAVKYRQLLLDMDAQRVERGGKPRSWNRLVDRMQAAQLRLRTTEAGRAAITALIQDENPTVRGWSAVNALAWAPELARVALEREVEAGDGIAAFEAEVALREHDAGRLDTAWVPKHP